MGPFLILYLGFPNCMTRSSWFTDFNLVLSLVWFSRPCCPLLVPASLSCLQSINIEVFLFGFVFFCGSLVPRMVRWQATDKRFSWNQWFSAQFCLPSPGKGKSLRMPVSPPFWAFIWFVFHLIYFALAYEGESCIWLLGCQALYKTVRCWSSKGVPVSCGHISKQNTSFVCFLGIWHLRHLVKPSMG